MRERVHVVVGQLPVEDVQVLPHVRRCAKQQGESVSSRQQPEGRWVRSGARFMERGCVGIPCCAFQRSSTCAGLLPTRFAMSSTSGSSSSFGRIGGRNVVQS